MEVVVVRNQQELDKVPIDKKTAVLIAFGGKFEPAVISKKINGIVIINKSYVLEVCKDNIVYASDRSSVTAFDDSFVIAFDNSQIDAYGKSVICANDSCKVHIHSEAVTIL